MDMPRKKNTAAAQAAARGPLPEVPSELLDHLVKGPMTPSELQDIFLSFQKAVIERTMAAEMNPHLGYRPGEVKPERQQDERNGASGKTVLTEHGTVRVAILHGSDI
jgi:putative transposase